MISRSVATMIENAVHDVALRVKDMQRAIGWTDFDEYLLWRELCSCILGSRVTFELARDCTRRLDARGMLRAFHQENKYPLVESRIRRELGKPIYKPARADGSLRSYTFPNVRSRQLRLTAEAIYGSNRSLKELLEVCEDEYCARDVIVGLSAGVGPKQASLFLRNVGFSDNLAILDTHVLRFMEFMRLLTDDLRTITTLTRYERTESKLQAYATRMSTQLSYLDTAIWIVMRVYQREFAT